MNLRHDVQLSIITPCFNEESSISPCIEEVKKMMIKFLPEITYEHIIADNCSSDQTFEIAKKIAQSDPHVKVFSNSRNIGAFRNIYRGLERASGSSVIPMLPADLQDPPEIIPLFFKEWKNGNLVVYGQRTNRNESLLLTIFRNLYYKILSRFSENNLPPHAGEFMLIDEKISKEIVRTRNHYPYIRGMVSQSVDSFAVVQYDWNKRVSGKSSNNFISLLDQAINGIISTSKIPARFALILGFITSGLAFLLGLWSFLAILIFGSSAPHGVPTLLVGVMVLGGMQMFFLGLIGEYVLSIHSQVRSQPEVFDRIPTVNFD